jgi:hypothetical protein
MTLPFINFLEKVCQECVSFYLCCGLCWGSGSGRERIRPYWDTKFRYTKFRKKKLFFILAKFLYYFAKFRRNFATGFCEMDFAMDLVMRQHATGFFKKLRHSFSGPGRISRYFTGTRDRQETGLPAPPTSCYLLPKMFFVKRVLLQDLQRSFISSDTISTSTITTLVYDNAL